MATLHMTMENNNVSMPGDLGIGDESEAGQGWAGHSEMRDLVSRSYISIDEQKPHIYMLSYLTYLHTPDAFIKRSFFGRHLSL